MNQTLKLTLSYDGTQFAGWQRQKNHRTVQQTVEEALGQITGQKVTVLGAGRTDSGVHAKGQVAHAVVSAKLSPKIILKALNAVLPSDLIVQSVRPVPHNFHARYDAVSKRYRYTIWNRPERPLFERAYLHHVRYPLDVQAMRRAARLLQGRRDFKIFHSSGRHVSSTVRNLKKLSIKTEKGIIQIDAEADGFLYHMVRRITGLLIDVGKGTLAPSSIPAILQRRRKATPPTAPAKGLCLMRVRYS